mmetsp:Transcript_10890/g.44108  ORF Transcript_10890/g.44108 Transcript_10890/m.44108 type:complete len:258 (-) Transcript_10890:1479-2252(-)
MRANCRFDGEGRHALWQAPWGKHNPVSWRGDHWAPQFRRTAAKRKWRPPIESVFPVVVVKDPLTWMKSMCRNHYEANFKRHPDHHVAELCPSPVRETRTVVQFQPDRPGRYASLMHLWSEWNAAYVNATFPRLMVRFEDLLFDTERTVRTACECVGGRLRDDGFRQQEGQAKTLAMGHRGPVNDRAKALRLYGSETERYKAYTEDDLRFAMATVLAEHPVPPAERKAAPSRGSSLLDRFQYHFRTTPPPPEIGDAPS